LSDNLIDDKDEKIGSKHGWKNLKWVETKSVNSNNSRLETLREYCIKRLIKNFSQKSLSACNLDLKLDICSSTDLAPFRGTLIFVPSLYTVITFRISKLFGLSITEEKSVVEKCICCTRIGIV
jgi:hypothetical protein